MSDKPKPGEVLTRERCFIEELVNDATRPDFSVARVRVTPGVTTELHALGVLEWYCIESGNGLVRIGDGEAYPVSAGDTLQIPAGTPQQITNTGNGDLLFLCVCVPRFEPVSYTPLE